MNEYVLYFLHYEGMQVEVVQADEMEQAWKKVQDYLRGGWFHFKSPHKYTAIPETSVYKIHLVKRE